MSLPMRTQPAIPDETARVAQAACKKDNLWLQLRTALDSLYTDELFAQLFSSTGRPALAPWRLALVCVLQFAENLSDEQAADAVRTRLDWKYLLALPLEDQGFDASVLSEFRDRLRAGQAATLLLDRLLTLCQERGWLKARGRQRTDSTHLLARVRELNRLELVARSLQHALEILADCAPAWLQAHCPPEWIERYAARLSEYRLPKAATARAALATQIGADGQQLLSDLWRADAPAWLRSLPAVEALRQIWLQQYYFAAGQWRWRGAAEKKGGLPPCAVQICSPHEVQARYAEKRGAGWTGYKVHLSETCDQDLPHLITQVTTTPATTPDVKALPVIQQSLAQHARLPAEQLVDSGYVEATALLASQQQHGIKLCGPALRDTSWQGRAHKGYATHNFQIDFARQQAQCPRGQTSQSWQATNDQRGEAVIKIKFARGDCRACAARADCTRTAEGRRSLTILPEAAYRALQRARQEVEVALLKQRAGVEGTISQAVQHGLRVARYVGAAKTHLQAVLTATAVNLIRLVRWRLGVPLSRTRRTAFQELFCPQPITP